MLSIRIVALLFHGAPPSQRSSPPSAGADVRDTLPGMAFATHAAVKTLTDTGATEPLAVAVVDLRDATAELVTRAHFDTTLAHLFPRLAPGHGRGSDCARQVGAALRFLG